MQEGNKSEKPKGLYAAEIERAREGWARAFDEFDNGEDRVKEMLHRFNSMLDSPMLDGESIRAEIKGLAGIEDKDAFVEGMTRALQSVIDLSNEDPQAFEALQRESAEQRGDKLVNEVFSYGTHEGIVDIHVIASKSLGIVQMKRKFLEGMQVLAQDVKDDESIKEVRGTSWIIYEHPGILEKMGFAVVNVNEGEKVATAVISRADLEKFL